MSERQWMKILLRHDNVIELIRGCHLEIPWQQAQSKTHPGTPLRRYWQGVLTSVICSGSANKNNVNIAGREKEVSVISKMAVFPAMEPIFFLPLIKRGWKISPCRQRHHFPTTLFSFANWKPWRDLDYRHSTTRILNLSMPVMAPWQLTPCVRPFLYLSVASQLSFHCPSNRWSHHNCWVLWCPSLIDCCNYRVRCVSSHYLNCHHTTSK